MKQAMLALKYKKPPDDGQGQPTGEIVVKAVTPAEDEEYPPSWYGFGLEGWFAKGWVVEKMTGNRQHGWGLLLVKAGK